MKLLTLTFSFVFICGITFSQSYMLSKKEVRQVVRGINKDLKAINELLQDKIITKKDLDDLNARLTNKSSDDEGISVKQQMLEMMVRRINMNIQKLKLKSPYLETGKIKEIIALDSQITLALSGANESENTKQR